MSTSKSNRLAAGAMTAVALALALSACGGQAAAPAATAVPAAKPTAAPVGPQKGGVVVIAIDSEPESLNLGTTTNYAPGDIGAKLFNGLVWLDPNFKPQPSLAESWSVSPEGTVYTFKLRKGVTWHDGKPFSSADVKFTMQEVLAKYHPRTQTLMKRVKDIQTPDESTVVVTLDGPYAPFLIQMTVFDAPIMPKHLYEGSDVLKNPANQKPVGTGPFKFSEWNRGQTIKLVRNEAYWDAGKPYLDGVTFQIVPQGANRSTGLETKELDVVLDFYLPKADVKRLQANVELQGKTGQGAPAVNWMMMNTATPALAKAEARQAIALVVDRKRLVDQAMGGIGRPGKGPFGDGFKWMLSDAADYEKLYPMSVEKAKDLLKQAGVADGTKLRLLFDSARPQFVAGSQIIKENLKAIGLEVELQPLERAALNEKVFANRDFDLSLGSFTSSGDPAIGYHRLYLTNTSKTANLNATGYANPKVDELLNKAGATVDQAERGKLYQEAAAILAKDVPTLVLFDENGVDFARKNIIGMWASIDSRDRFDLVSLTK